MITEDCCSPEVSKILKEKGLDIGHFRHYVAVHNGDGTSELVSVCTHQIAMKWLRKKGIDISITPIYPTVHPTKQYMWEISTETKFACDKKDSYEEAVDEALKYSLEKFNII